jgi:transcriptional regulator with XRE-family HTH domain
MATNGTIVRELRISRRLLDQYRMGRITLQRLADIYDVSVATVWRALKQRGISRGSRRGRPRNTEKHSLVIGLAAQGLSRRQIAEQVGITPEWVRCILAHHGLFVSLRILKCVQCGCPVANGRKAGTGKRHPQLLCANCLRRCPNLAFGERLRALRLSANLSRAELGRRSNLSRALIGNYERGEALPTQQSAHKLAHGLGISLYELSGHALDQGAPVNGTQAPTAFRAKEAEALTGLEERSQAI